MRGTVGVFTIRTIGLRITPAHAGNSKNSPSLQTGMKDHPRTCGEQKKAIKEYAVKQGSPPHMRGTGPFRFVKISFIGITPAHAGNRRG